MTFLLNSQQLIPPFSMKRNKSTSELNGAEVNGTANQEARIQFAVAELGDLTRKNWTYLTNEVKLCLYSFTAVYCDFFTIIF